MSIGRPDMTLVLDTDGIIRDVTLADSGPRDRALDLIGRAWMDTVGDVGVDKVRSMVEDARASRVSR